MKRIIPILLILAMLLSFAVTAHARGSTDRYRDPDSADALFGANGGQRNR